jgi:hypothetical protein
MWSARHDYQSAVRAVFAGPWAQSEASRYLLLFAAKGCA